MFELARGLLKRGQCSHPPLFLLFLRQVFRRAARLPMGERSNSQRTKHWPRLSDEGFWKILKVDFITIASCVNVLFCFVLSYEPHVRDLYVWHCFSSLLSPFICFKNNTKMF